MAKRLVNLLNSLNTYLSRLMMSPGFFSHHTSWHSSFHMISHIVVSFLLLLQPLDHCRAPRDNLESHAFLAVLLYIQLHALTFPFLSSLLL